MTTPKFADLNEELSNLRDDQKKDSSASVFKAYRAKSTKEGENSEVKAKAWSKLNRCLSLKTDAVMDRGCTYPVTTTAVTKEMKAEIKPLKEEFTIMEASCKWLAQQNL